MVDPHQHTICQNINKKIANFFKLNFLSTFKETIFLGFIAIASVGFLLINKMVCGLHFKISNDIADKYFHKIHRLKLTLIYE